MFKPTKDRPVNDLFYPFRLAFEKAGIKVTTK